MGAKLKRKFIRAMPDWDDTCLIDFDIEHTYKEFHPTVTAFIVNESPMGGCGIVVHKNDQYYVGRDILIKLGKLLPLRGKIVWVKEIDIDLLRVGVELLE